MDSEAYEKRPSVLTSSEQDISPHIANVDEMKHYLCGGCAAFDITITFPIQQVLFRQQLYGIKTRDLRRDGFRNLYPGILPVLMQTTTTLDLSCLLRKHVSAPEFATCCVAAVLAGTAEAIFTPLEIVQTLLQGHKHHDKFTNTYQTFKALKYNGIGEYYRGPVKEHLPTETTHSAHLVNDFICEGLLVSDWWGISVFPKVYQKIWLERDGKLVNLFRGAHLNYRWSLISCSIINATYE
uniref:Uncharacterized protein n=1 Tax=Rhinopithecus roxellana TaxID=61622 RepID=A0A2K6RJ56_RHIRO